MNKMKRILISMLLILSIVGVMTIGLGLLSEAEEYEMVEPVVIAAEDIGIETNEEIEEEFIDNDSEVETEDMDVPVQEAEQLEDEESEVEEPETESPAPPEGKVEGYVAGVYFDPNENDCEICDQCYKCEDDGHIYAHCVSVEDDTYIYEEWCTICGHGTCTPITDEEFCELGVETCVEF